jgi:GNAT acetyltransferase-like protein
MRDLGNGEELAGNSATSSDSPAKEPATGDVWHFRKQDSRKPTYRKECEPVILHEFPASDLEKNWRGFLSRAECPAHYDSPEFFLEPWAPKSQPFAILALQSGEVVGVATGVHAGKEVISGLPARPQISLDKNIDPLLVSDCLAEGLLRESRSAQLVTVYAWKGTQLPGFERQRFRVRELEGDVVLDLRPGAKTLFERFRQHRRRDIRAAERNGIEVFQEETTEDLHAYWETYQAWRASQRKKIHHNRSFDMIERVHHLRGNHRRFLARYQSKVIAGIGVRFFQGGLLEFANNCSREEFLDLFPNDLLVWRIIEWACENGFSTCSMGAAHPFLRKWGGTIIPICRYRLDRSLFRHHDLMDDMQNRVRRRFVDHVPAPIRASVASLLRSIR